MDSKRFQLNKADVRKWLRNTALFLAPLAILVLAGLQQGATIEELAPLAYLWLLNTALDLVRKFVRDNS